MGWNEVCPVPLVLYQVVEPVFYSMSHEACFTSLPHASMKPIITIHELCLDSLYWSYLMAVESFCILSILCGRGWVNSTKNAHFTALPNPVWETQTPCSSLEREPGQPMGSWVVKKGIVIEFTWPPLSYGLSWTIPTPDVPEKKTILEQEIAKLLRKDSVQWAVDWGNLISSHRSFSLSREMACDIQS